MLLLCGIGILHSEPFSNSESLFEGVLKYELDVGGRKWTIQNTIKGQNSKADIYLNDLKFQSVLSIGNEVYLIDHLGKRIVPLFGAAGQRGGANESARGEKGRGDPPPPPFDGNRMKGGPDTNKMVDPETPVDEGTALGQPSLKFAFKEEKRKVELEGITGYGRFPFQVFAQFEDLKEMGPILASTLQHHHLIPVFLHVTKRKHFNAVEMELVSIEEKEISDSGFEFPNEYAMKVGAPKGGGEKGRSKGGRGGPPPGGERGGKGMGK